MLRLYNDTFSFFRELTDAQPRQHRKGLFFESFDLLFQLCQVLFFRFQLFAFFQQELALGIQRFPHFFRQRVFLDPLPHKMLPLPVTGLAR